MNLRKIVAAPLLTTCALPPLRIMSRVLARSILPRAPRDVADVAIVLPPASGAGWILDGVCNEIASRIGYERVELVRCGEPLPAAQRYFFAHGAYTLRYLSPGSPLYLQPVAIFTTHIEPEKNGLHASSYAAMTRMGFRLVCMNLGLGEQIARAGAVPQRLHVVVGAADSARFLPHRRDATGFVGLCSSFYPRKSPELVLEIVTRMPHRQFLLLGRGWRHYGGFRELQALPNFKYVEADYAEYACWYAKMSVFLSVSTVEGGPIPLLESMMSNVVPVASRTGFAPDIIRHGQNGFVFAPTEHTDRICQLIDLAFALDADVSSTVSMYDWDRFAREVRLVLDRTGVDPASASLEGPCGRHPT